MSRSGFSKPLKQVSLGGKKPSLLEVMEEQGVDPEWIEFVDYFIAEKDTHYHLTVTVTSVFFNFKKDTASLATEFDLKPGENPGLDFIFNHPCMSAPGYPFYVPWIFEPSTAEFKNVKLKIGNPNQESATKWLQPILTEDGEWLERPAVTVVFKFNTYTQFPEKTDHGISCRLVTPIKLNCVFNGDNVANRHDDPVMVPPTIYKPTHFYE